eukprot:CAMPEP_0119556248 /NCGR_PEP_ID=MMETSP1352-20130426/8267_1 /TAXON_ID=265584 /ORGANISM="Stauroneis constricta, Strain CCMP1120" /LENGTH=175 /DNA_ID=CAMNT_0007603177 /DNA_START=115 /DNA_END=639 /DNA_ORIENTATION=+
MPESIFENPNARDSFIMDEEVSLAGDDELYGGGRHGRKHKQRRSSSREQQPPATRGQRAKQMLFKAVSGKRLSATKTSEQHPNAPSTPTPNHNNSFNNSNSNNNHNNSYSNHNRSMMFSEFSDHYDDDEYAANNDDNDDDEEKIFAKFETRTIQWYRRIVFLVLICITLIICIVT